MSRKLEVDSFAFIGRTLDEYLRMFDLDIAGLEGERVLDCPGGACSFVAEASAAGLDAVAADVLYGVGPDALASRCEREVARVVKAVRPVKDLFKWGFYGDISGLEDKRIEAWTRFIRDYGEGCLKGRYVEAELPELPFGDGEFSLVLSGHFLFLYGDRLDVDFHVASIRELLRVASKEVRIFPLVGLDSLRYTHLDSVIGELGSHGIRAEVAAVPFEFQKGATEMLRVSRNQTTD